MNLNSPNIDPLELRLLIVVVVVVAVGHANKWTPISRWEWN